MSGCVCCNACAQPQDAYGLEKLASEELGKHYGNDFGIDVRIARFHNIYGPYGTWKGGREKAPAAFCRKVRCRAPASRASRVAAEDCTFPAARRCLSTYVSSGVGLSVQIRKLGGPLQV